MSQLQGLHEFLDGGGGFLQRRLLGIGELDLPDLLDPLGPELGGDANVQVADPELALEVAAAGRILCLSFSTASTISAAAAEGA